MITPRVLYLKMNLLQGSRDLVFAANPLVCGGWVAKGQKGPARSLLDVQ